MANKNENRNALIQSTVVMSRPASQFLLVVTGHNTRPFLDALAASLARQRWPNWRGVFVDDASTDGTGDAFSLLAEQHGIGQRFEIVVNVERQYKARNVMEAVHHFAADSDVVVIIDADDHLAVNDALDRLAREYEQGWEVVWSNWRGSDGSPGSSGHLNPFLSPRRQPHLASHLFSFRRPLFDAVTVSDLQDEQGRWFEAACDIAIALPILDQTIKRKHIEDVLYVYNRSNPLSHDRLQPGTRPLVSPQQARNSEILRRRPPKPLTVDNAFLHAHLYELLQAAMLNSRLITRQLVAKRNAQADHVRTDTPSATARRGS
jgi:glycosyltransferase involved in cell wall biosynthesis